MYLWQQHLLNSWRELWSLLSVPPPSVWPSADWAQWDYASARLESKVSTSSHSSSSSGHISSLIVPCFLLWDAGPATSLCSCNCSGWEGTGGCPPCEWSHLHSSLVLISKLRARWILRQSKGENPSTHLKCNHPGAAQLDTKAYPLHGCPPAPVTGVWRGGSALRSAQEDCSKSVQHLSASPAIEAVCLFLPMHMLRKNDKGGFANGGISESELSFQHQSRPSTFK